ncbi:hypothetical protein EVJ58_g8917 [Rhodofomes roseus]|uniref:Major facilitator superfamily (MFS) profile domain-containing protein n=1 Tax=Rhodofomes roseus TaxID=34475 RepID=A0A4Y9XW91_9APHY|nr:hypothetical protein EVJ58_g8917 [Rhodofomes roseus]
MFEAPDSRSRPAIAGNPYVVGSFTCIGDGLFGLDISSMFVVLNNPAYNTYFGIVASMPAGSFAGALAVTYLADRIGRKWTVIISGCILQCASQNVAMLIAGRVIAGIAVGIASSVVPIY